MIPILLPLLSSLLPLQAPSLTPAQGPAPIADRVLEASARTLLLQLVGDRQGLRLDQAWQRAMPFLRSGFHEQGLGELELLDHQGKVLFRCRFTLEDMNLDPLRAGDVSVGCKAKPRELSLLVKVPDLGLRAHILHLYRVDGTDRVGIGRMDRRAIDKALTPSFSIQSAPKVRTHLKNGDPKNRYDIVVVGDGYLAKEEARFVNDVTKWMANLFSKEPHKTYKPFFNVHSVFRASKESGADHPDRTPPIVKDTVYDAGYNFGGTGRCLYIRNGSQASKDAALAPDVEGRIVVFVNDSRYGGCASTFAVSYNGGSGSEVQSHEFGHSFGRLADEYDYGRSGTYGGSEPGSANLTADKTGKTKWPLWMNTLGVSVFEGGGYYKKGLYRPMKNCLMRSLGRGMCHVCIEQCVQQSYAAVNPIEDPKPAEGHLPLTAPAKATITFKNLVPGGGKVEWLIDGKVVATGGTSYVLDSSKLTAGSHKLQLRVTDTTNKVRKGVPVRRADWSLDIYDPTKADLRISSFVAPIAARSGGQVELVTKIRNDGKTAAGAFELEHFVNDASAVSWTDAYLGSHKVAGLAAGKEIEVKRKVSLPMHLLAAQGTVLAMVDRKQAVDEGNRSNNEQKRALTLQQPTGCPTRLESTAILTYPPIRASLSLGGSSWETYELTSPCDAGKFALVLWGCKGTSPGVKTGGFTIPLNWDPVCTPFALATMGSGPFFFFAGKLDAKGTMQPLVYLERAFPISPFDSDLVGIVFKADFSGIERVSNPVRLRFTK